MPRVSAFALVGCAGFVVQLSALEALTVGLGVPHLLATAGAVEVAILHNFAWHERWTWADRTARAPSGTWRRFGRFHLSNGAVSLVGNLVITAGIVALAGAPLLLANTLAVGACTALNFVAADRLVFRREQEVEA
jgi:putative flippase GtrA